MISKPNNIKATHLLFLPLEASFWDSLPSQPGVYFFEDENKKPIYIGKSVDIRSRIRQHYEGFNKKNTKSFYFVPQTKYLYFKTFQNDIQAIIAESNYIKTFDPKYNSVLKDDKSYLYLVFTNPPQTKLVYARSSDIVSLNLDNYKKQVFGPYTSHNIAQLLFRQIKKTFGVCLSPFNSKNKPCFNYHLNQCPGACCGEVTTLEYQNKLGLAKKFLNGKFLSLQKHYLKEIKKNSKKQNYEYANKLKTQYEMIMTITESKNIHLLLKLSDSHFQTLQKIISTLNHPRLITIPRRIECYDLAHHQGKNYVGAMTVSEDGVLKNNQYRHFHINEATSDPHGMKEIIERRLKHTEWPLPQLIILDGGKPQLNIVLPIVPKEIAVVALAKRKETLIYYDQKNKIVELNLDLSDPVLNQFIVLRDEAHRFGNTFHAKSRSKSLLL